MQDTIEEAIAAYRKRFGQSPAFGSVAPGRVEVLGNHTDYNGGYVMSAAIDRVAAVVGSPTGDDSITLAAQNFDREAHFDLEHFEPDPKNGWASYMLGVVDQLRKASVDIRGFRALILSGVPVGSGLSSSAALEVSTALFLKQIFPFQMENMEIAKLCQRAENQFVGVSSGLMDQFSAVFGKADSLLFLDCLTYEHETISLHRDDVEMVICNSMVKHALTGGDYNTRRAECMTAAAHFGKDLLRDVSLAEFDARKQELPENQRKRAQHVLRENERVVEGRSAAAGGDLVKLGSLMSQSHASSRDLFENSAPELDFLAETAMDLPGCYGARLTGGGWGGATINLVDAAHVEAFSTALSERYEKNFKITPQVFICRIADGAQSITL